jgi:predicted transcriptional regulator
VILVYKVGVVGPELSIERILEVAREFEKKIMFLPFPYKQAIETKEIVLQHRKDVDAWLFSGPIPYAIAKGVIGEDDSLHGILSWETGLYNSLISLLLQKKAGFKQISIDLPDAIHTREVRQLDAPIKNLLIQQFPADVNEQDVYRFHSELWEKGDIDGVLTCYPNVKEQLEQKGIPVSWITTTRLGTKQTLVSLSEKAKAHYYQNTQVAICFIEVEKPDIERVKEELLYDIQSAELKMEEALLRVSRQLNGSFQKAGKGDYMIFSSRGDVTNHIHILQVTIQKMHDQWKRPIAAGVGFGDSVLKAEYNARKAVQRSRASHQNMIVIVDEQGKVEEYRSNQEIVSYISKSDEPEIVHKLTKFQISVQLYNKIRSYVEQKQWDTFTSRDIAIELGMSFRNSQRILLGLRKAGLVEEVGETKSSDKGRPMKLYRFHS